MVARPVEQDPEPKEITADEGWQVIDKRARRLLGMSGREFVARYEAGELDESDDGVALVAMLLPLGR